MAEWKMPILHRLTAPSGQLGATFKIVGEKATLFIRGPIDAPPGRYPESARAMSVEEAREEYKRLRKEGWK